MLAPYVDEGVVVVHDWPMPFAGRHGGAARLSRRSTTACATHRDDARWIAFIDLDEFLFSPTGTPLPEVLPDYERLRRPSCVSRAEFGPSGHRTRPAGLVIENYVHRRPRATR